MPRPQPPSELETQLMRISSGTRLGAVWILESRAQIGDARSIMRVSTLTCSVALVFFVDTRVSVKNLVDLSSGDSLERFLDHLQSLLRPQTVTTLVSQQPSHDSTDRCRLQ